MIVFGKMPDLPRSYVKIKHFDTETLQKSETQKKISMNNFETIKISKILRLSEKVPRLFKG